MMIETIATTHPAQRSDGWRVEHAETRPAIAINATTRFNDPWEWKNSALNR